MKSKFLKLILSLCTFWLLFSHFALAEEVTETQPYLTVNNAILDLSPNYGAFPAETVQNNRLIEKTQAFAPTPNNLDSLTVVAYYIAPLNPEHKDNIRFRYDFRSDEIAESYAAFWQKRSQAMYQLKSSWQPYKVKKINQEAVLVLKGQFFTQAGSASVFHEHYLWANTPKSEIYALTIIYQEKTKENQKEIKRLVDHFQFPK